MRANKVLVLVLAFVLLSPLGGAHASHDGTNGRSISGASPLPEVCNLNAQPYGWRDVEFEPHIAVNPTNPNNIVVSWTQNFDDTVVVGVSHDGGANWSKSIPPMTSLCSGGLYTSAVRSHLSFDPEGVLYLSTASTDYWLLRGAVTVHRSTDGGQTWSDPATLEEATFADLYYPDHWSWVTADPTLPGTVYATWQVSGQSDPVEDFDKYDMRFARSTDGGIEWSPAADLNPSPEGYDRLRPTLVGLPDGSLLNMFSQRVDESLAGFVTDDGSPRQTTVMAARSTDQGNTWSTPVEVAVRHMGGYGQDLRVGRLESSHPLNVPAVSSDGTIYYSWSSNERDGSSTLNLTSSFDGGITWTAPQVIRDSDVPMAAVNLAVAPDGTVGVQFYDYRNDVEGDDAAMADVWLVRAAANSDGLGEWKERHLAGPFDIFSAPAGSEFGFSHGLAGAPAGFVSTYAVAAPLSTVGLTDIFFRRIYLDP